ncbi:uncharacterized protein PODANS_5_4630 [Podospora anserina S mat+]|uniref:Podospora anserina S mat+ genomic DNA chromosome 5, supercontig 5 n=1 Tax=Podospora anserina (strain S / ATCC MYA-4624 / DSM 980 / FGSC 10383) TaxID=515849 RepID=B2AMN6_PODAN|nr:uncharacterized protein PODANS_5_4630 [Podospora anserina S mat+]CAP65226.1 unnamed protein product [Podospora anserina S mat+]CDP29438.1 Putative protein of unknown function [Podospora anserina S mat+]
MVSFTLSLCGKDFECSESTSVADDDITDPDIAVSLQILLSFILPSVAAIIAFLLAWIKIRIPQQQYNCIDDMALPWFKRGPSRSGSAWTATSEVSGYQGFILLVNDQMLLTGFGLIIAIYSQICSISMFSFHAACDLAYLCCTVHLATLTVLRLPFKESTKAQRNLRVSLMILGLTGILVCKYLQYSTWEYDNASLAACDISWPRTGSDFEYLWDWFCLVLTLSVNYYQSIVTDVAPRLPSGSDARRKAISSWVLVVLEKLHGYPGAQNDIEKSLEEMQEKNQASSLKRFTSLTTTINKRRSGQISAARLLWAVFANVGFDVVIELQNSIIYDLFLCTFWFALAITDLITSLTHGGADITPLLDWKFGQVLPVILLVSYALTALGIKSSSRTRRRQSTSVGSSLNTASPENLSHSDSGSLDSEVDLGTGPGLPMRSFTNTGFSSQNEDPRSRPTRRVNTVELERAIVPERAKKKPRQKQRSILDVKDYITQPIDLIDFSRREAQGYIGVVVVAAFLFLVGFLVQMYFFFRETVTALTGLYIFLFFHRVVRGSRAIRRIKMERLRREHAILHRQQPTQTLGSQSSASGTTGSNGTSLREENHHFNWQSDERSGAVNPWMHLNVSG